MDFSLFQGLAGEVFCACITSLLPQSLLLLQGKSNSTTKRKKKGMVTTVLSGLGGSV